MPREIQLCLVYRDMWQSSGKYMPNANQLSKVAEPIINMKCWDRIETNGGGFEQIQLLAGENPNEVVRKWTKPFNEVGIKTQMLERGLNALSMSPVSEDVRELMFSVKSKQGTNISRYFDGLNDPRNLELSIKFANASGMISQSCLCITHSKIHTVDYYISLAKKFIELGTKEIAIKDMAGIGRPSSLGKIVKGIKNYSPNTIVQYHGHSGPGFSVASALEVARAGADIVDVSMEPLSWGTTHADLLTIHEVLRDDGFIVKDFDKKAYMEVKQLTQEFIDESLGYYINQKNRLMNSLLISSGLPGGMMGSLMSDLEKSHLSINKWLKKNKSDEINIDFLFSMLSDEVNEIWPKKLSLKKSEFYEAGNGSEAMLLAIDYPGGWTQTIRLLPNKKAVGSFVVPARYEQPAIVRYICDLSSNHLRVLVQREQRENETTQRKNVEETQ